MRIESKISIGILVVGILGILTYSMIPQDILATKEYSIKDDKILLPQYDDTTYQNIPEVQSYLNDLRALIKSGKSILPIEESELDSSAVEVQKFLLQNKEFLKDTKQNGKLIHNDMMRILPAIVSSLDPSLQKTCQEHKCYQAEKYNYVTNSTTRAIVDIDDKKLLQIQQFPNTQPDINLRLTHIAQAIALNAPEVRESLQKKPSLKDMSMANVRGSLMSSPCENSIHLCVAPTFADHKKERALWAIVDLTKLTLAAAKWAGLGKTTTPACISERSLQNRYIMENFCQKDTTLDKNGWSITYRLTGSDGLEIRDVLFKGKKVIRSAKIVDWHVSYKQMGDIPEDGTETYIENRRVEYVPGENGEYLFGYNDAMGCPMFSTSVVLAFNGPVVKTLKDNDGFMITQDFRNPKWPMACNYRYENRFEFYNDGSFRVVGVNKGRGCGDNAIYRPVMRIDFNFSEKEQFYRYTNNSWEHWTKEQSDLVKSDSYANDKYLYKITDKTQVDKGYYIEPNRGQFNDNSRGDNATIFVTQFKKDEGDLDLLTLGSCCNLKEDGIEQYIKDREDISSNNIVVWYVPHIINDIKKGEEYCWADTVISSDGNLEVKLWPCVVGPKFVPISAEVK